MASNRWARSACHLLYFKTTKVILVLSSKSRGLEFWSANHTSIYENSELKVFKNIKLLGEISNNWPNDLFGITVYKTLEFCWELLLNVLQCIKGAAKSYFMHYSYVVIVL